MDETSRRRDAGKMNKADVRIMLTVIRLKEFVARKILDKEENIGENEKMILSCFL